MGPSLMAAGGRASTESQAPFKRKVKAQSEKTGGSKRWLMSDGQQMSVRRTAPYTPTLSGLGSGPGSLDFHKITG